MLFTGQIGSVAFSVKNKLKMGYTRIAVIALLYEGVHGVGTPGEILKVP
jgi:hypothetical protein